MATFKQKRDERADWEANDPILEAGVIGFEIDTNKFKFGNGISRWSELPYHLPDTDIEALIADYVNSLPTGDLTRQELTDHINSDNPHPNYDSGLDLTVLYDNVKAG